MPTMPPPAGSHLDYARPGLKVARNIPVWPALIINLPVLAVIIFAIAQPPGFWLRHRWVQRKERLLQHLGGQRPLSHSHDDRASSCAMALLAPAEGMGRISGRGRAVECVSRQFDLSAPHAQAL